MEGSLGDPGPGAGVEIEAFVDQRSVQPADGVERSEAHGSYRRPMPRRLTKKPETAVWNEREKSATPGMTQRIVRA